MELRSQENDTRSSVPSTHSHRPSGIERIRKDGDHNGNTTTVVTTNYTQSLDQHHHHQLGQARSPNPDRSGSDSKSPNIIRYRECLRNHAASVGGSVFDGCGEFMLGGEEGSSEALKCAACDCHRNFHRKEVDGETQVSPSSRRSRMIYSIQLPPPLTSPTAMHHHHHQRSFSIGLHTNPVSTTSNMVQPMTVAFGGSRAGTDSSSEELNPFQSNAEGTLIPPPPYVLSKKRYRTKFTQEQKDKMMEFAEKVGWRINKQEEEEMEKFCAEVGVRRQVFKVWMHNNKNMKRQQQQQQPPL